MLQDGATLRQDMSLIYPLSSLQVGSETVAVATMIFFPSPLWIITKRQAWKQSSTVDMLSIKDKLSGAAAFLLFHTHTLPFAGLSGQRFYDVYL